MISIPHFFLSSARLPSPFFTICPTPDQSGLDPNNLSTPCVSPLQPPPLHPIPFTPTSPAPLGIHQSHATAGLNCCGVPTPFWLTPWPPTPSHSCPSPRPFHPAQLPPSHPTQPPYISPSSVSPTQTPFSASTPSTPSFTTYSANAVCKDDQGWAACKQLHLP